MKIILAMLSIVLLFAGSVEAKKNKIEGVAVNLDITGYNKDTHQFSDTNGAPRLEKNCVLFAGCGMNYLNTSGSLVGKIINLTPNSFSTCSPCNDEIIKYYYYTMENYKRLAGIASRNCPLHIQLFITLDGDVYEQHTSIEPCALL